MYGYTIEAKGWQLSDAAYFELEERDNPEEAIKYLQAALKQQPDDVGYLSTLALAYEKLGAFSKALDVLTGVLGQLERDDERYEEIDQRINSIKRQL